MITAYGAACLFLGFMLALYLVDRLLDWLPALARAHRRGLERLALYDAARQRREVARAIDRHPSGFLPKWTDVTDRVRSVTFAPGRAEHPPPSTV